jgi:hypothetical protein
MSIKSFFRRLFGSSEKAVEVSTPVVVVEEEKVTPKEIGEKAKVEIEQRLKEISEEKKSEEKKVTAKEIKAKVKKTPETKVEQSDKPVKSKPKKTEKKDENKPKTSRKKTDK